jgi:hypothetical protein
MKLAQYRAEPGETPNRVDRACHDINTSLSTVVLCIEFLAERSDTVGDEAVRDARIAIRHISTVMATLRDALDSDASVPRTSAVFRKTDPPGSEDVRPAVLTPVAPRP